MAKNLWQVFSNYISHLLKLPKKERPTIKSKTNQKKNKPQELSIILFCLENRLYIYNVLFKCLDRLSVKTFLVEQVLLKW